MNTPDTGEKASEVMAGGMKRSVAGAVSGVMAASVLAMVAGTALAQGGRLPDPPAGKEGTPSVGKIDNYDAFIAAYQRSSRPRLVVYVDVVSREGQPVGGDIGDLVRLSSRVEEFFRNPDVVIVNAGAQSLLSARQVVELRRVDELEAARMVASAAKADVVLFVRLVQQEGRRDGSNYLGTMTLADLRQGTTLGRHSWEMTPEGGERWQYTSQRMGDYAKAIARKAAQFYIEAYPATSSTAASAGTSSGTGSGVEASSNPFGGTAASNSPSEAIGVMRRFSVLLVGNYEDDTLSDFRDSLRGIPGVRRDSVLLREEDRGTSGAAASFEMMYAGDSLDLRTQVRRVAIAQMGMEATVISSREGSISVKLAPLGLSVRERALSGGPETARNADERAMLAYRYDKAGAPTIAVMVNEASVEVENAIFIDPGTTSTNGNALQQGDGVNIVIADRVGVSADGRSVLDHYEQIATERDEIDRRKERRQDAAIDTMFFENKVVERLVQLGLRPRDISAAQVEMGDDLKAKAWKDRELAAALGKKSGADVVLSGVGRLVREKESGRALRIVFTMRAYEVNGGTIIGAASISRDVSTGDRSFNQSLEELSAEATGKLVTQMSDAWARQAKGEEKATAPAATPAPKADAAEETGSGGGPR